MIEFVLALLGILTLTLFAALYIWHLRMERLRKSLARRKKGDASGVADSTRVRSVVLEP